jgi:hypothetical protein
MNPQEIYVKTEKGREEIQTRRSQLPPTLRTLLIMIDGRSSAGEILKQVGPMGITADALEQLIAQGLVALDRPAPAAQPASVVEAVATDALPDSERFLAARQFMTDTVVNAMGLRSFMFTLKLEKAETLQGLRSLLPEYTKLMEKGTGHLEAEVLIRRVLELIR